MKHVKDPAELAEILHAHEHFLFDCDGVIWNGDELTPRAAEAIKALRDHGKKPAFVTNNATASRKGYREKFSKHSIDVEHEELFTSGSASAHYIKSILPDLPHDKRGIFVIGQEGFEEELREVGLEFKGGADPSEDEHMPFQDFSSIDPDPSIGIVLVSFDMHLNYRKLCKAFNYLSSDENCRLVLTNTDSTVILPDNKGFVPGEGAMAAPLLHAREGLKPTVVGKPEQILMQAIKEKTGFHPERTIVIGDRLESDIKFGKNGGLKTLLVLTGATQEHEVEGLEAGEKPDFMVAGIGDFVEALKCKPVGRAGALPN